ELLGQANSLDQFVRLAAWRLLGPAMGGWIIALAGTGGAFLTDAATFSLSILCVSRMTARRRPVLADREGGVRSAVREVLEGFRFVRSHVWLWGTFLAATIAYLLFLGPSEVLLPFVVKNSLHRGAQDLGFILAVGGIGALFAAALIGARGQPR